MATFPIPIVQMHTKTKKAQGKGRQHRLPPPPPPPSARVSLPSASFPPCAAVPTFPPFTPPSSITFRRCFPLAMGKGHPHEGVGPRRPTVRPFLPTFTTPCGPFQRRVWPPSCGASRCTAFGGPPPAHGWRWSAPCTIMVALCTPSLGCGTPPCRRWRLGSNPTQRNSTRRRVRWKICSCV